jgi:hypothetical protein
MTRCAGRKNGVPLIQPTWTQHGPGSRILGIGKVRHSTRMRPLKVSSQKKVGSIGMPFQTL